MSEEEETKVCKHCAIEKSVTEYNKAGGGKWLQPYCKPCDSLRKKKYSELNRSKVKYAKSMYYMNNKQSILEKTKEYIKNNKDIVDKRRKIYYANNIETKRIKDREYRKINAEKIDLQQKIKRENNPEWYKEKLKKFRESRTQEQKERNKVQQKEWRLRNKNEIAAQRQKAEVRERTRERNRINCRIKSSTDIQFRILKNLRSRIHVALKRGIKKSNTTTNLLGCTIPEFKIYFSSLFTEGMTWDLYMKGEIHIDHIKPCVEFDLTQESEQQACFNYRNMQPLWKIDNLRKGRFYEEKQTA